MADIAAALERAEGWVAAAKDAPWMNEYQEARANLAGLGPASVALARALLKLTHDGRPTGTCDACTALQEWAEIVSGDNLGALGATVDTDTRGANDDV